MLKGSQLVGIFLQSDVGIHEPSACMGSVVLDTDNLDNTSLHTFRSLIQKLINPPLPNFQFCSKQGWPICVGLEHDVNVQRAIKDEKVVLKRLYDKPKVAIQTKEKVVIGFVFCNPDCQLADLRHLLNKQIFSEKNFANTEFHFLDQNGWPVSSYQESKFLVANILDGYFVSIDQPMKCLKSSLKSPQDNKNEIQVRPCSVKGTRQLSFRSSKDLERFPVADSSVGDTQSVKQILISYVRAEAAQHALQLKQELSHLGFSVYLDIHEIRSGLDWQDSLNYAVSNCEIFVPLVTPKYGETQWTNREVKLADVLGKYIIPVNFLEMWPPRCLAIQFSTTQYINWKTMAQISTEIAEGSDMALDIRFWEQRHVKKVASGIKDLLSKEKMMNPVNKKLSLTKRRTVVKSCTLVEESTEQALLDNREGRPLVVICVHQDQQKLGLEIKNFIKGLSYEVWCTTCIHNREVGTESEGANLVKEEVFQEKADDAGVIVALLSKEFIQSKTCQQQLYYCEQRKRLITIMAGEFETPGWLELLLKSIACSNLTDKNYKDRLPGVLQKSLDPKGRLSHRAEIDEARILCAAKQLKKIMNTEYCVYVHGPSSETGVHNSLYRSIAGALCDLDDITLVTGGCYNTEYLVGTAFYEMSQQKFKTHQVWHILPETDSQDRSKEYPQNTDGSFQVLSYGQTYFCGNSLEERDLIVAKTFDICLLFTGDLTQQAIRLALKFSWNDHYVIPINLNKDQDPTHILQVSQGISHQDYLHLSKEGQSPDVIASKVKELIQRMQSNMKMEKEQELDEVQMSPPKKVRRISSKTSSPQKTTLRTMNTVLL